VIEQTLAGRLRMGTCNPYLCSPGLDFVSQQQWVAMLQRDQELVRRDRLGIERYRPVIQYGVLAEQRSEGLPPAATLALDSAVGGGNAPRGASLRDRYPTAMVLSCRPGG